ncbi:hypothetical protein IWX90DRAFT_125301 [Phyllosticta citrichinensis]|uniref:Uncharacterized protein n=1 Tax=Phyllosticta citrichinensis TaxID=1130410 RepID=A0ABR1Y3Z5_9PEZI
MECEAARGDELATAWTRCCERQAIGSGFFSERVVGCAVSKAAWKCRPDRGRGHHSAHHWQSGPTWTVSQCIHLSYSAPPACEWNATPRCSSKGSMCPARGTGRSHGAGMTAVDQTVKCCWRRVICRPWPQKKRERATCIPTNPESQAVSFTALSHLRAPGRGSTWPGQTRTDLQLFSPRLRLRLLSLLHLSFPQRDIPHRSKRPSAFLEPVPVRQPTGQPVW